jgi:hypothetical protein
MLDVPSPLQTTALLRTVGARRLAVCLLALWLVACAGVARQRPLHDPIKLAPPQPFEAAASLPPDTPQVPGKPSPLTPVIEAVPAEAPAQNPDPQFALAGSGDAPTKARGALLAAASRPGSPAPAPAPSAIAPQPALDIPALKLRLRDTRGMGVLAKLSLRQELDKLLRQLRSQHDSGQTSGLALLRVPYNSLVQKVLAALREGDPELANSILASREAIWTILSDRTKFYTVN